MNASLEDLSDYIQCLDQRPEQKAVKQGDEDWHKARNSLLTMSDTAAMGGFHPNKTTYEALRAKMCPSLEPRENFVTQRGHDKEPVARQEYLTLFQALYPDDVMEVEEVTFVRHETYLFLGGSPDGVLKRNGKRVALLEIKTAFKELYGCMPTFNTPQTQGLADILQLETIHFVCWMEHGVHVVLAKRNRRYFNDFLVPRLRATYYMAFLPLRMASRSMQDAMLVPYRPQANGPNHAQTRCKAKARPKQDHVQRITAGTLPPPRFPEDEEILIVFDRKESGEWNVQPSFQPQLNQLKMSIVFEN